ncbi:MAG: hypothetical protein ACKV19_25130, partial [Verrucomicrobiales bacterium]
MTWTGGGDEREDVYLCQPGGLPNLLLRQKTDGSMEDISSAAGVDWLDDSTGALLVDLDGELDLLVLRYGADSREVGDFPTPHPFYDARNGGANVLLENQGGFQFADATAARGLDVDNHRFSFAASWEDYDNDGDPDIYIAND